jgi:Tol biopolymer transport system component
MPSLRILGGLAVVIVLLAGCGGGQAQPTATIAASERPIAYIARNGDMEDLFIINGDGSGLLQLTDDTLLEAYQVWSPDGTRIAFDRGAISDDGVHDIFVINRDGSGLRNITNNPSDGSEGFGGGSSHPSWSPDGQRLTFLQWYRHDSPRRAEAGIYIIDVDGSNRKKIVENAAYPIWSPVDDTIAYIAGDVAKRVVTLNVIQADGTGHRVLATHSDIGEAPTWSPDGTRLAFVGRERVQDDRHRMREDIYVVNIDGSGETRLTDDATAMYFTPTWSPTGHVIAFTDRVVGSGMEIATISVEGSNLTVLTQESFAAALPAWSPDGAQIAFLSYDATNRGEVYVMNADGSARRQLTTNNVWYVVW